MPSIRTFVQLGRIPLIATWPVLPFESNEGAALGVGATPGSNTAALNRSRSFSGSSVKLRSEIVPLTVEVVLSIVGTSALAVICCGTLPTCNVEFTAIAAAALIAMPSRISVWNPSFSIRTTYFPVGKPITWYWPFMSVRASRFNPVLTAETVTLAPGITAPVGSVTVPKTVPSCVCDQPHVETHANDRAKSIRVVWEADFVEGGTDAIINCHPLK
jgi:hypothetical protein